MLLQTKPLSVDDKSDYTQIHQPHQLTLEEKDELLFALVELLECRVYRAEFDPSLTLLTKE